MFTPVFSVPKVAGTTGAGDSTIAGFLASVFKGLEPSEALTMAVAVGGCCVEAPDADLGHSDVDRDRPPGREGLAARRGDRARGGLGAPGKRRLARAGRLERLSTGAGSAPCANHTLSETWHPRGLDRIAPYW